MTRREKVLVGGVVAAGLLMIGKGRLDAYQESVKRNRARQETAESELSSARVAIARGHRARQRLRQWQRQSLPTNREVAESLYQDWLREQLTGAGLEVTQLADKSLATRNPQFTELAEDVTAKGTLAQLADFLYRFYTAPHLHRISEATITAEPGGEKLTVALTVNGLILPGCPRADKLADGVPQELPLKLEEYRTQLVSRNLFSPPKPKADAGGQDEEAAGARVTGMMSDGAGMRLSVRKKNDELAFFHEGDSIAIGKFTGKVLTIDVRRVIVETDKGKLELRLGKNLSEATAMAEPAKPGDAAKPADTATESAAEKPSDAATESTAEKNATPPA